MGYYINWISAVWGVFEPLSALVLFIRLWTERGRQRTSYKEFGVIADRAFELAAAHIERSGIRRSVFAPRSKSSYIDEIKGSIEFKRKAFQYSKGELELFFLSKFILPKDNRARQFLIVSFFYIEGYDRYFKFLKGREWFILRLKRKAKTLYHYLSIPNWADLRINTLITRVNEIEKVDPNWNLKYKLPRAEEILEKRPAMSRALEIALDKGRIPERTVFNLSSSEKLIFVHKYGEGFSGVYREYEKLVKEAKNELSRAEKSKAKGAAKRLEKARQNLTDLNENWPRVPLNTILEEEGFQKLFRKLDGVYVLPLSLLPVKYQEDIEAYFTEVILDKAKKYLRRLKLDNAIVSNLIDDLKYLLLFHIVTIRDINILAKDRSLEVSSKALSKMLFSTFLAHDKSKMASFYINDLVRNIDFRSLIKPNKTGNYLKRHFDLLNQILFADYNIQLYRPIGLVTMTDANIVDVVDKLLANDASARRHLVSAALQEIVAYYKQLDNDLQSISVT